MSKVTLRKKPISKGRQSLYLEIYPAIYNLESGKMQRKIYLKLYVYKSPKNEIERELNKKTIALGEYIRAQRLTTAFLVIFAVMFITFCFNCFTLLLYSTSPFPRLAPILFSKEKKEADKQIIQ